MTVARAGEAVDPRVVRSRAAVLTATVTLLGEQGWTGTTVEAISERSGVAKTTIYRHWDSRAELILDAFNSLFTTQEFDATGDLYADLVTMLCRLADALEQAEWSRVLPALVEAAERDPALGHLATDMCCQRRQGLIGRLQQAVEAGDLAPDTDVELMGHLLADPLFFRRLLSRERTTTRFIEALVDRVLRAFGR